MPIDTHHPEYDAALRAWVKVLDVLGGERPIKAQGELYLPSMAEQPPAEYQAYKHRAVFLGATLQTHMSFIGFLFRKDPVFTVPDSLKAFMADATLSGFPFYDFVKDVARAVTGTGRRGTLIDWDQATNRPYVKAYNERSIINWRTSRMGNQIVLTTLILEELSDRDYGYGDMISTDEYELNMVTQWRSYQLEVGSDGVPFVHSQVWRRKVQGGDKPATGANGGQRALPGTGVSDTSWILCDDTIPSRRGVPLQRIPFVFHGPNNHLPAVDRVPMEDIASINISHYQTSADLENVRHICGIPTPIFTGFQVNDTDKIRLGSTVAMCSDNPTAKAYFLSLGGTGAQALEGAMTQKEKQMESLGARMFDSPSTRGNAEAYDTVRIRQTGETVSLTNVALAMTQSCSLVMQWAAWWLNTSPTPEALAEGAQVVINSEFVTTKLDAPTMQQLLAARAAREISRETFFFNMQEGEMYEPDWTFEKEEEAIASEPPPTPPPLPGGGAPLVKEPPTDPIQQGGFGA
jgi:hypothetical protein